MFGSGLIETAKNLVALIQGGKVDSRGIQQNPSLTYKKPEAGEVVGTCLCGGKIKTIKEEFLHFNKCELCGEHLWKKRKSGVK